MTQLITKQWRQKVSLEKGLEGVLHPPVYTSSFQCHMGDDTVNYNQILTTSGRLLLGKDSKKNNMVVPLRDKKDRVSRSLYTRTHSITDIRDSKLCRTVILLLTTVHFSFLSIFSSQPSQIKENVWGSRSLYRWKDILKVTNTLEETIGRLHRGENVFIQ